jgi:hypothetical protein
LEYGIDGLINETYMKKFSWSIVNGNDVSIFYIFVFFIFYNLSFLIVFIFTFLVFDKRKKEKIKIN